MTNDFSIFCKSYAPDLKRAFRLAESVETYNVDGIPFYLACPEEDLLAFQRHLRPFKGLEIISEQEILRKTLGADGGVAEDLKRLPAHLMQQLIKSEYWRLGLSDHFLIVDSDSFFIRPFFKRDFMSDGQTPYTVFHESKDLFGFAARKRKASIKADYQRMSTAFMAIFGRQGRHFDFGPTPLIWSARVWEYLYEQYALKNNTNIVKMLCEFPCEILWYGEALMYSRVIPIIPVEPLFKVYHYKAQFLESLRMGENETILADNYLGIVFQSNWDKSPKLTMENNPGGMGKRLRQWLDRI